MIPEVKSDAIFKPKGNETLEAINARKAGEFRLVNKMLVLTQGGQVVGKFTPSAIHHQVFGNRLIAYLHKPKVGKEIVFEVTGAPDQLQEVGRLMEVHNKSANYKSPLQLIFATTCQESVLVSSQEPNLRGFLNLFIVLSVITYSRLILVSLKEFKGMFMSTVGSSAARLPPRLLRLPLRLLLVGFRRLLRLRLLY